MKARLCVCATALAAMTATGAALGDPMDPALERFAVDNQLPLADGGCWAFNDGEYVGEFPLESEFPGGAEPCIRDDAAFKKLIGQYGFALAPTAMHSARTTGLGGFHVSIEAQYTKINDGSEVLERGTRGRENALFNENPPPILQVYSLNVRKGFGFGLEVGGNFGFLGQSHVMTAGADLRLSLLEGFRGPDWPGYLPDVAIGGGLRTIAGTAAFELAVTALDFQISKPIPLGNISVITPWIGYQYVWISGDSGLVDLTPHTDPLGYCNYAGDNIPGNWDGESRYGGTVVDGEPQYDGDPLYDGQPSCVGGSSRDFANDVVFDRARFERQRLLLGAAYRYEMVMVGAAFITDLVSPARAQRGGDSTTVRNANGERIGRISDKALLKGEPAQWSFVVELGTVF